MSFWDDVLIEENDLIKGGLSVHDVLERLKASLRPSELEEFIKALGGYTYNDINKSHYTPKMEAEDMGL